VDQPYADRDATLDAFARHVSRGKVDAYRAMGLEVVMGEREGAVFHDAFDGRSWINCHGNGGVFNLGHRNPAVLAAVTAALAAPAAAERAIGAGLDVGNHHLVSGWRARLGERLAATTGGRLATSVLGVSGGEAVDVAIKAAWAATGRRSIVSVVGGYHGHTGLALATGDPQYRDPFGPNLPGFVQVPFDDLAAMERAVGGDTAAVIMEPIPATLGMPIASPGYLAGVERLCHERGALFIADEVQTGLGRTGRMWCHQHDSLSPDIVVTGKGLSGGVYPITATLMTDEVHRVFDDHPFVHISTFGGAEPGCAAALAVLDVVEAPGFLERVEELGRRFEGGFAGLPFELRRRGLMMGLKFGGEGGGLAAAKACYDAGVFAVFANNDTSVLQFLPPLVLGDEECDDLIARVAKALG